MSVFKRFAHLTIELSRVKNMLAEERAKNKKLRCQMKNLKSVYRKERLNKARAGK